MTGLFVTIEAMDELRAAHDAAEPDWEIGGRLIVEPRSSAGLADLVSGYAECLRHSLQGNQDMNEIEVYLPAELTRQVMRYGNPPTCVALAISAWIEREYRERQLNPQIVRNPPKRTRMETQQHLLPACHHHLSQ